MKINEILCERHSDYRKVKKNRAHIPRPPKTLWYTEKKLWQLDLSKRYPDLKVLSRNGSDVAVNDDAKLCYGKWNNNDNKGVTFHAPRPIHVPIHKREKR